MSTTLVNDALSGFDVTGGVESTKKRLRSQFAEEHPHITMSAALESGYGVDPVVRVDDGTEYDGAPGIPAIKQEALDPAFAAAFGPLPDAEVAPPPKKRRRRSSRSAVPADMQRDVSQKNDALRAKYEAELKEQELAVEKELADLDAAETEKRVAREAALKEVIEGAEEVPYAPGMVASEHREDVEKKRAAVEKEKAGATYKTPVSMSMMSAGLYITMGGLAMMAGSLFLPG